MAFTPNQVGMIENKIGFDLHGSPLTAPARPLQFAVINLRRKTGKTTVRADSSASRGSADEITTDQARILVAKHERINIGDVFLFDGDSYDVLSKHVRRSILGMIDHYECDLEVRPR